MTETIITWVFLAVSVVSLVIQLAALGRLRSWPDTPTTRSDAMYRGLVRTSTCRVVAAAGYVLLGAANLFDRDTLLSLLFALSLFASVQVLWWGNAAADLRLRRRLAPGPPSPMERGGPDGPRT